MQQPAQDPEGRSAPTALDQETVQLGVAAKSLGLSAQALWALIQQQGLQVLRLKRHGRACSALTRVDHDRLVEHVRGSPVQRDPQVDPERDVLDPLMERVREAEERSLALEGRLLEMRTQVERSSQRAHEARDQMALLRTRFEGELAASQAQLLDRARNLERTDGQRRSLQHELDLAREGHAAQLEALVVERDRACRQLDMASELERAHHAYLDRLERLDQRRA